MGRTTHKLRTRINEHRANIKNGFPKHSVSNHFRQFHNKDPTLLVYYGIEKIKKHWRGKKRAVSQNKTKWLYKLDTLQPLCMNRPRPKLLPN